MGHESTKTLIEKNTAKFETPKIIKFSKEYELWLRYVQIPKKPTARRFCPKDLTSTSCIIIITFP